MTSAVPPLRILIFGLIGLSLGIAWYQSKNGGTGPNPRAQCLVHSNCEPAERCVVVPRGDGFATFGQCGVLCADDAQCPNGWKCRTWAEVEGTLQPERGQAATLPRVKACAHQSVK